MSFSKAPRVATHATHRVASKSSSAVLEKNVEEPLVVGLKGSHKQNEALLSSKDHRDTAPPVALHTLERPVLDGPSPFSAGWKSAVQQSVDSFMLALPLGASEQDALIEEAVARQLYDAEIGKATLQKHLHDWVGAAEQLERTVRQQQRQIQQLQDHTDQECTERRDANHPSSSLLTALSQGEFEDLQGQLQAAAATNASLRSQLAAASSELHAAVEDKRSQYDQLNALTIASRQERTASIDTLNAALLGKGAAAQETETLRVQLESARQITRGVELERDALQQQVFIATERYASLQRDLKAVWVTRDELQAQVTALLVEQADISSREEAVDLASRNDAELAAARGQVAALEAQLQEGNTKLRSAEGEADSLHREVALAESAAQDMESDLLGAQLVMQQALAASEHEAVRCREELAVAQSAAAAAAVGVVDTNIRCGVLEAAVERAAEEGERQRQESAAQLGVQRRLLEDALENGRVAAAAQLESQEAAYEATLDGLAALQEAALEEVEAARRAEGARSEARLQALITTTNDSHAAEMATLLETHSAALSTAASLHASRLEDVIRAHELQLADGKIAATAPVAIGAMGDPDGACTVGARQSVGGVGLLVTGSQIGVNEEAAAAAQLEERHSRNVEDLRVQHTEAVAALNVQHESDLASQRKSHEDSYDSTISDLRSQIVGLRTDLERAWAEAANAAHSAVDLRRGEKGGERERSAVYTEAERLRDELETVKGEVQALWTALETELEQLASTHMAEITQLEAVFQAALLAKTAAPLPTPSRPHDPHSTPSLAQHSSQEDSEAGLSGGGASRESSVAGDVVQMGRAEVHAAEVESIQEAFVARLAAAEEEIEIKSARLAELEDELDEMHSSSEVAAERAAECQEMLTELQEFAAHQQMEITELQRRVHDEGRRATSGEVAAAESGTMLQQTQEEKAAITEKVVELQLARDGVEAEVKGLSLARHAAESEGAAARGRAAGLEAACEAQVSQIEMLTAHLTAARHRRVTGADGEIMEAMEQLEEWRQEQEVRREALTDALAVETRRRAEAEAHVAEIAAYNSAILEQSQEQNETLLAAVHERERTIRDLAQGLGLAPAAAAAYQLDLTEGRQLGTTPEYLRHPAASKQGVPQASPMGDRSTDHMTSLSLRTPVGRTGDVAEPAAMPSSQQREYFRQLRFQRARSTMEDATAPALLTTSASQEIQAVSLAEERASGGSPEEGGNNSGVSLAADERWSDSYSVERVSLASGSWSQVGNTERVDDTNDDLDSSGVEGRQGGSRFANQLIMSVGAADDERQYSHGPRPQALNFKQHLSPTRPPRRVPEPQALGLNDENKPELVWVRKVPNGYNHPSVARVGAVRALATEKEGVVAAYGTPMAPLGRAAVTNWMECKQ